MKYEQRTVYENEVSKWIFDDRQTWHFFDVI